MDLNADSDVVRIIVMRGTLCNACVYEYTHIAYLIESEPNMVCVVRRLAKHSANRIVYVSSNEKEHPEK